MQLSPTFCTLFLHHCFLVCPPCLPVCLLHWLGCLQCLMECLDFVVARRWARNLLCIHHRAHRWYRQQPAFTGPLCPIEWLARLWFVLHGRWKRNQYSCKHRFARCMGARGMHELNRWRSAYLREWRTRWRGLRCRLWATATENPHRSRPPRLLR